MLKLLGRIAMRAGLSIVFGILLAAGCGSLLPFNTSRGFEDLSGEKAKLRLEGSWPKAVDASLVQSVSYRLRGTLDTSSIWYRVELEAEAAERWKEQIHTEAERHTMDLGSRSHYAAVEGVHRTVAGPPSLRNQTGMTPPWWSPPAIDFDASEAMLWYEDYDSGVAEAAYSGFDESASVLWIYEYTCQHDRMWARGEVPEGDPFEAEP